MAEMLKMEVIDESHIIFLHYIVLVVKEVLTTAGYMKDQCPMPQVGHCTVFLLADCRVSRREKRPSPLRTAWFVTCVRLFQSPSHCSATWPRRSTCRWIKRQPSYPASIPRCRGSFGLAGYYHQFVLNFADLTKRVAQIWSSGRSSATGKEGPLWGSPASLPFILQTDTLNRAWGPFCPSR